MKLFNLFILVVSSFLLFSCLDDTPPATKEKKENTKSNTTSKFANHPGGREIINAGSKTQYTGKPGQLLIVSDKTEYTVELEELFDSVFSAPIRPYYPVTPYFTIFHRTPEEFKKLTTSIRNVIDLKIDNKVEKGKPTMHIYENYYSRTQLYTILRANDMADLHQLLEDEIQYLFTVYNKQEWKREYLRHTRYKNESTRAKLQDKFGIDLQLPSKYRYESIDDTYAILIFPERSRQMDLGAGSSTVSKTNYTQTGIMIWQYPYTSSSQMEPENLLKMRDSILKKYAKYDADGVYMGTQYHPAASPIHEALRIGEIEGYQFRGLFKFTGAFEPSGGRYWEFQFKHPHRNTIVAISAYIDVPPTMDANLDINIARAVIYSVKPIKD